MKYSVCLCSYNGEKYIEHQVNSIIRNMKNLNHGSWEIIVSDDCSSDDTIKILEALNCENLKIIEGPCLGPSANFQNAILQATGDICILSDQDDYWLKNRMQRLLDLNIDEKIVVSNAYICDENLSKSKQLASDIFPRDSSGLSNFLKNSYTGAFIAGPRSFFLSAMPFPKSNLVLYDWWLGLIFALDRRPVIFDVMPTILYRRHLNTVTKVSNKRKLSIRSVMSRLLLLSLLIKRTLSGSTQE